MASEAFDAILAIVRSTDLLGGNAATPDELRRSMLSSVGGMRLPDDVTIEPVDAGGVPGEWTRIPGIATDAVLLYLHGGGYVIGSPVTHRNLCATIASGAGIPVLSLDYRLAPEHPHPAAVTDATAAYSWLLEQGFLPSRIAIAGDSAGGGLTIATLVKLRDDGVAQPAAAVAISPWVDIAMTGESMVEFADLDPIVEPVGLGRMADWFIDGGDKTDPLASPIYADLHGLAPVLIHVGAVETLLDDSRRLHKAIAAAGGRSELVEFPEMVHVFHAFCNLIPEADAAVALVAEFIREHLVIETTA